MISVIIQKINFYYVFLVVNTDHFLLMETSFHKDRVHDVYGVNLDKTGVTEETLDEQGSNIVKMVSFVDLALKCAVRVDTRNEAISKLECGQKRKSSEDIPVKAKLSKVDKVDVEKKAELDDPAGLEVEFQQKFMKQQLAKNFPLFSETKPRPSETYPRTCYNCVYLVQFKLARSPRRNIEDFIDKGEKSLFLGFNLTGKKVKKLNSLYSMSSMVGNVAGNLFTPDPSPPG